MPYLRVLVLLSGILSLGVHAEDACHGVCTAYAALAKKFRPIRGEHDQWLQKHVATHRLEGADGCWVGAEKYECVWDFSNDEQAALSRYQLLLSEVRVCLGSLIGTEHLGFDGRNRSKRFVLANPEAQVLASLFFKEAEGVEFASLRFELIAGE